MNKDGMVRLGAIVVLALIVVLYVGYRVVDASRERAAKARIQRVSLPGLDAPGGRVAGPQGQGGLRGIPQ